MSRSSTKWHITCLMVLITILLFAAPSLLLAETDQSGEVSKAQEAELAAPVITLRGQIDRVGENELVIDDILYSFAPDSGLKSNSFSEGQLVNGELDTQHRISALQIFKDAARPAEAGPRDTDASGPPAEQPIYMEDGVWKN